MINNTIKARSIAGLIAIFVIISGCSSESESVSEQLAKAKQYKNENKLRASVIEFKIILKADPKNAEARHLLGETYFLLGDQEGAIKELSRAKTLGLANPQLTLSLINALIIQKNYDKALQVAKENKSPQISDKVRLLTGNIYIAKNEIKKASDIFNSKFTDFYDKSSALLGLANIALANNDFDKAFQLIEKSIKRDPTNTLAWERRGEISLFLNKPADAEVSFNTALKSAKASEKNKIILLLAQAQTLQNKNDLAQESLNSLDDELKQSPQAKYQQALILLNKDETENATKILEETIAKHPNYLKSYLALGKLRYEKGSVEQASEYAKIVLKTNPSHPGAIKLLAQINLKNNNPSVAASLLQRIPPASRGYDENALLGSAYLKLGKTQKATEFYEAAAKQAPGASSAKTNVAISKIASGKINAAISDLKNIIKLDPSLIHAQILLIQIKINDGSYQEAIKIGKNVLSKTPDNALAHTLLGTSYLGLSNESEAENQFKQALAVDSQSIPALLNLAELYAKKGNLTPARQLLEKALANDKKNIHLLMSLAKLELTKNNYRQAINYLETAIKFHDEAVQPRLLLAEHYLRTKNYSKTQVLLKKLQTLNNKHPLVISLAGRMHSINGNHKKAERMLQKVVMMTPESIDAFINLGTAQFLAKNYSSAKKSFNKVMSLSGGNEPIAIMRLARIALISKNTNKAKEQARLLQTKYPDFIEGYVLSGDIFYIQKDYKNAVREYNKIDKNQFTSSIVLSLSNAYNKMKKTRESINVLSDWIKSNPDDFIPRLVLASNYENAGENNRAISQYEDAIKITPDSPIALNNLAMLYQKQGNSRALEIADKAVSALPNNPAILDTAGWINYKNSNSAKAIRLLQKAATLAPNDKEIAGHLEAAMKSRK